MGCLTSIKYSMTAEAYTQTTTQQRSGAIKRVWDYDTPISIECLVVPLQSNSLSAGTNEQWGQKYMASDWANIFLSVEDFQTAGISKRSRIGNIKTNGVDIFWSMKLATDTRPLGTVFDVLGITPIVVPFIGLSEYKLLVASVQEL